MTEKTSAAVSDPKWKRFIVNIYAPGLTSSYYLFRSSQMPGGINSRDVVTAILIGALAWGAATAGYRFGKRFRQ